MEETLVSPADFFISISIPLGFSRLSLLVTAGFNQSGYSSLNLQRWKRIATMQVCFCAVVSLFHSIWKSDFDLFGDFGSDVSYVTV